MAKSNDLRISFISGEDGAPDLVEIRRVGNPDNVLYKITEKIEFLEKNFPDEFAAYKRKQESPGKTVRMPKPKGTALTKIEGITNRRAETLKRQDVQTVEQLAALSDASCNGIGSGVLDLRKQARAYLMDQSGQFPKQVVG
jgi:predicted flap endonuclease-1-like 5' DNA nuclease